MLLLIIVLIQLKDNNNEIKLPLTWCSFNANIWIVNNKYKYNIKNILHLLNTGNGRDISIRQVARTLYGDNAQIPMQNWLQRNYKLKCTWSVDWWNIMNKDKMKNELEKIYNDYHVLGKGNYISYADGHIEHINQSRIYNNNCLKFFLIAFSLILAFFLALLLTF